MVSEEEHIRYALLVLQSHIDQLVYNGALTNDDAGEMQEAVNYLRSVLEVK